MATGITMSFHEATLLYAAYSSVFCLLWHDSPAYSIHLLPFSSRKMGMWVRLSHRLVEFVMKCV